MKNNIIIPKTIILLLALMPVSLKAQGLGRLLYESVYTSTGLCWQEDGTVMNNSYGSVFYAEIYENCLVETSGIRQNEYYYTYIGSIGQDCRVYCRVIGKNNCNIYIVDHNYNLTRVYERDDLRFPPGKVKIHFYYEIVKGDCLPKRTPKEILDIYRRQVELWEQGWNLSRLYYD